MKIIKLAVSNIGGVEAFEIEPNGDHVVVGGKNGAGKSTVLHAISGALGGGKNRPRTLRDGTEKGSVIIDLGEYVVRWRTNAAGNDYVSVETADGAVFKSPQKLLDRLWGDRTFDPLKFMDSPPKEQAATLAGLAGIDLEALDETRRRMYQERTAVNRLARDLQGQAEGYDIPPGTPDEPLDTALLALKLSDGRAHNDKLARLVESIQADAAAFNEAKTGVAMTQEKVESDFVDLERTLDGKIEDLKKKLDAAREAREEKLEVEHEAGDAAVRIATKVRDDLATKIAAKQREIDEAAYADLAPIEDSLTNAGKVNAAVQALQARDGLLDMVAERHAKSAELSAGIDEIDAEKTKAIAAANLPIDGLGLSDGAVTLDGRTLSEISESERLRLSVALGIATNPEIAVMLIDRWNDLDEDRRKLVSKMADEAGCQIFATVVGENDPDVTVTIRDGNVING